MEKDYSIYIYYKGKNEYPNKKSEFFGFYESMFECTYEGNLDDKEEAFKEYMSDILYEQASEMYHFGNPGVDVSAKLDEYLKDYFNPELNLDHYNG